MPTLLETLSARGMVHDATPDLGTRLGLGPVTAYAGFDPTADSLGVGSLMPVMGLAWLQRLGGRPLVVIGGGTGMIGDPSGKRAERQILDPDTVQANAAAIQSQLARFLEFGGGPTGAAMVNNADWLAPIALLDFLRDTGKHFTVNYMLQKESVKSRMDAGISFTEFSYMLVQAYDFAHLAAAERCELQLGGSDQWGNITAGIELAARRDGRKLHGLVMPLLTTASGAKFGKTETGNIWLDPSKTSPYAFHQYWLQTSDADVERLLRFMTFLDLDEISEVVGRHTANPGDRGAQRRLADDVTLRVHGASAVEQVNAAARILFGGSDVRAADAATLAVVAGQIVTVPAVPGELDGDGLPLADALIRTGLAASKSDARRGLESGGYTVNGAVADGSRRVLSGDVLPGGLVLLRKGKKNWAALQFPS
ncbi:MAG: tyrosine--tRNA ligase [Gemmatimonadales bacterium]